ncbi:hypothetical protein [Halorientalis marina]|jgi:hypothetical protein|nr:hypothetical protein [Halorientalis marina]
MCHCFEAVTELTDEERRELIEEHSERELRDAYSDDELDALGIAA